MIVLIGANGSMGKRYQSILNFFQQEVMCFDIDSSRWNVEQVAKKADGVIIATPTGTHLGYLKSLLPVAKKILVEKPVTKDLDQLEEIYSYCGRNNKSFQMMFQYKELVTSRRHEPSHYDYFNHGKDGLAWDCMQTIGLACGEVKVREASPVWDCVINGQRININEMDRAYLSFVKKWLNGSLEQNHKEIMDIHIKVQQMSHKGQIGSE